jgi:NTP pyrophosphatase (non-canonical NTP hydrolase)
MINKDIGFRTLQKELHKDSYDKGWWHDTEGNDLRNHPFTFPTKAMLIVTEVAEAIEGDRKGIADTHLPQYSMKAVELADVQIRLMDLAEAYDIDLLEVILAKRAYNKVREDHQPKNRSKKHGKKY